MVKEYYTYRFDRIFGMPLKPSDGVGDEVVRAGLATLGFSIPAALFDYYSVAGNHYINRDHNILRSLAELEWFGNMLVFMEENQTVAYWGVKQEDCALSDPIVWQGQTINPIEWELEDGAMEWYAEDYRMSQFLMAMWNWTLTGEPEQPASNDLQ